MEKDNISVVYVGDNNYMKIIENAIRVGASVLLCGVQDTLDAELTPVLNKEIKHRYKKHTTMT